MRAALVRLWQARAPRERQVIVVAAAIAAAALYLVLVLAAERAREPLREDVARLRTQADALDAQALDHARLQALPAATASRIELKTIVQGSLEGAGLAAGGVRVEAPDPDHVVVVFSAVAFADWLRWVDALQVQRVRLETSRIDALPAPGRVQASATFVRPPPR